MSAGEWEAAHESILRLLDVEARFVAMGVRFTDKPPNARGWRSCFARSREEAHPSAVCNVGDGPARGMYVDKGGDHLTLRFFDFAARYGGFKDWKEARNAYAKETGVKLPGGAEPTVPLDALEWTLTRAVTLKTWTPHKPPITPEACLLAGARLGLWPKKGMSRQAVVAIPVFGPHLTDAPPVNFVMYRQDGEQMERFVGKDKPIEKSRMLTLKDGGTGLLNAHALERLDTAEFIWKVEGPTDVLAALSIIPKELLDKHIFITNPFGSGEPPASWVVDRLTGKHVILAGDADKPGQVGVTKWQAYLRTRAASLRVATLPYPVEQKHGKDLRDFFGEGHSYEELLALAGPGPAVASVGLPALPEGFAPPTAPTAPTAPPAVPALAHAGVSPVPAPVAPAAPSATPVVTTPISATAIPGHVHVVSAPPSLPGLPPGAAPADIEDADVLMRIEIHVLGHYADNSVAVFSEHTRQMHVIDDVGRLSYPSLLLFAGSPARDNILGPSVGTGGSPGAKNLDDVKRAIAMAASAVNLSETAPFGQGVWMTDSGEIALICGGEALVARGSVLDGLESVRVPRVGTHLVDFAPSEAWCDLGKLREYIGRAAFSDFRLTALEELRLILKKWPWKHPVDAEVCLGLAVATWIQTVWPWRPIVSLTGPTSVGKSTLVEEVLSALYGKLATVYNKTTEAGIRQKVGNRASMILVDEFENDHHRTKVLELFRTTSRGGEIYRGSSDQRGRSYGLRHIPWTAAIESGLIKEADRNRFIIMELRRLEEKAFGKVVLPDERYFADLGLRLLASILVQARVALELFSSMRGTHVPGVHGRVVECYCVPAAALAALSPSPSTEVARATLHEMLSGKAGVVDAITSDENELMNAIMESFVDLGGGQRRSVSQILHSAKLYDLHREALERHGVGLVSARHGPRVHDIKADTKIFLNPRAIRRHLLRFTPWADLDCEQLLKRVDGATRAYRRIDSLRAYGVDVPAMSFIDLDGVTPSLEEEVGGMA